MGKLAALLDEVPAESAEALRPSEYTAALIRVLRARASWVSGADALEIGFGSGVVLAALGGLGAASLCGVDIDSEAVAYGALLLRRLGLGARAELHRGDMWQPLAGRRFGLIAANLPHFPMDSVEFVGRRPSWSSGGPDGRRLLDRFLDGLAVHLAPGGRAVITHNAFVGLDRSRILAAKSGLACRVAMTQSVHISPDKLALMTPEVFLAEAGHTICRYGPYAFADLHVIEIGTPEALG